MSVSLPRWPCLPLLLLSACDGSAPAPAGPQSPAPVFFDFGTIAHGKAGEHDFVLDSRTVLGSDYVAIGVQADCSCARSEMLLRDRAGHERRIAGQLPDSIAAPGEVLIVHLQVDTAKKEAVDFGPVESKASVIFQRADARDANHRVLWPLTFRFAIDSPVRLRPFAVLDFERVPVSAQPEVLTTIASDVPGRTVRFGPARCDDPRLALALEPAGDLVRLRARFTPGDGPLGSFRALVTVDTDLPDGYQVRLAATGKVVPDLEAVPFAKLAIRTDLHREQTPAAAASQYLVVTDHDRRRPVEFRVARLVDAAGRDASSCFEVRFEPIQGDERSLRLFLRYLGGAEREFRGELLLAKDPRDGPFLSIELVAFHTGQQP